MARERWLPVVGHEEWYEVSDQGHVRSWFNNRHGRGTQPRPLSANSNRGYPQVNLRRGGKHVNAAVHRLVARAFLGEPPGPGMQVAHLNGNPSDARPENLKWTTPLENNSHKLMHGTLSRGEHRPQAKLTESDVRKIRELLANGEQQKVIAAKFGVVQSRISKINTGLIWSHVV